MEMIPRNIIKWCCAETERQHDTPKYVDNMVSAWLYAYEMWRNGVPMSEKAMATIAWIIKPGENGTWNGDIALNYRRVQVTIGDDMGLDWREIPDAMKRLMTFQVYEDMTPDTRGISVSVIDQWVKHLLEIHPWLDGNGRTASVVWNWMKGTIEDPKPLPRFFGER